MSKKPDEIFTPRSPTVNESIYIHRPSLENDLKRAIHGTKNILIHGESGCGKSWLYKKVLNEEGLLFEIVNLANAVRSHHSISEEIQIILNRLHPNEKIGYSEEMEAQANAVVAQGKLSHTNDYVINRDEPLEAMFKHLNKKSHEEGAFLVFDNLESIFTDTNMMEELGSMITLLDDDYYSSFNIKLIIVGVPSGVLEYYRNLKNLQTVSNRLVEIPQVAGLSDTQVNDFIKISFIDELSINFKDENTLKKYESHIFWVTNGIPQRLHEYCLELSYLCQNNGWFATEDLLIKADKKYLANSLLKNYSAIEGTMNSYDTKIQRRNQVLYCLGQLNNLSFKTPEIECLLRKCFNINNSTNINISQSLSEISGYSDSPIKKISNRNGSNGDSWQITDSLFLLCLRVMLKKDENDKIEKIDYSKI